MIYFEGRFVEDHEALIPVSDRGFQFGDGAFATIQVRDGVPLFLEVHLKHLKLQCLSFKLHMPPVERETIEELIVLNRAEKGIWRLKVMITGGDGHEARLPQREGRVVIYLHPFTPLPFKPLKIGLFPTPYSSCHASYKSLAHLNRFYVMEEAYQQKVDDCVTLTEKGYLLEAAFGNLFWVKEKTFMTPDPSLPLYFGVTIKNMIELATGLGFEIQYVKSTVDQLPKEATAFRANTMQGVRPIAQIGAVTFAQNSVLQSIFINGYEQMIEKQKELVLRR